jgi:hypothetical protein
LANERQLLSHADLAEQGSWHVRTIKDNLRLFTPEHLVRINQVVVDVGHTLVKKACTMDWLCAVTPSWSRTMHFPADINLLYDAVHKEIEISAKLCDEQDLSDWRQSTYNLRCLKKAYRHVQSLKRSKSKDKRTARSEAIKQARRDYLRLAGGFQLRAQPTGRSLATVQSVTLVLFAPLDDYIPHGKRIVHEEKVFSIFEPHAERIN